MVSGSATLASIRRNASTAFGCVTRLWWMMDTVCTSVRLRRSATSKLATSLASWRLPGACVSKYVIKSSGATPPLQV